VSGSDSSIFCPRKGLWRGRPYDDFRSSTAGAVNVYLDEIMPMMTERSLEVFKSYMVCLVILCIYVAMYLVAGAYRRLLTLHFVPNTMMI
jgi:hypothetical protein